jgi:hypothetical protein
MTITIRTRDFGVLIFNCPSHESTCSGYVIVRSEGSTNWRQPCEGGGWRGSTLMAKPETLRRVALKWLRQRRRATMGAI